MNIMKRINLVSDVIDRDDMRALAVWLLQEPIPQLTKGELTIELERRWAMKVGTRYSLYVNSGSSAILLLLAAIKEHIDGKPKIVCPAVSWATDVSSPMLLDYDIILCDCNMDDLSCDLNHLEDIFKVENPDIFISVSPLGLVPDIKRIKELCESYYVTFIEDNCESMGSSIKGRMLGSFGDASVFSMYYGHHLSTIEGGFVNTNNSLLYDMMLSMRSHGWGRGWVDQKRMRERRFWGIDILNEPYTFYHPGFNVRSTDLQAFLGLRMLKKLDKFANIRNENFHYYYANLEGNVLNIEERDDEFISNFAYPYVHPNRDKMIKELMANDIETRPLIAGNIGLQPFWINKYGMTSLPNADIIHKHGFYLPNHQDLTVDEMSGIIKIINSHV